MTNIKVVVIGDTAVGKTSISARFVKDEFHEFSESTIGAAFLTKTINDTKFEIWDTAGQERYRSLTPMYYRGAGASLIVFDITDKNSFDNAKSWIKEIQEKARENCIIILVGNKCDLDNRVISYDIANQYAEDNGIFYIETSAKNNINIENVFEIIDSNSKLDNNYKNENIFTTTDNKKKVERKCC